MSTEEASAVLSSNLGLVCITASDAVRFRALTRKRLLQLDPDAQTQTLRDLYRDNLARLNRALNFCRERRIRLYRMTSGLFPFADEPVGRDVLEEMRAAVAEVGRRARRLGLRLVLHPDQFVVLSSDSPHVIVNSVKILETHAFVMDMLCQPRTPWALMEIHGGKSGRSERLIESIGNLPENVRTRIAFENDEYGYGADEILDVCRRAGVPMVFDAHHHIVHEQLDSYEHPSIAATVEAARSTWPVPEWQLVHISNGRTAFGDRHHSDLIVTMPTAYRNVPWIEVEAKHKEFAIDVLNAEWPSRDSWELDAGAGEAEDDEMREEDSAAAATS